MTGRADLHVHTAGSDGLLSPTELLNQAVEAGLSCVGITDHDTTCGLDEAVSAAGNVDIEAVPGIEISAVLGRESVHVVGYFIDWHSEEMDSWIAGLIASRRQRAVKMVEKLQNLGYGIELERVKEIAGGEFIGRPHVAAALKERGFVKKMEEAFSKKMIGKGGKAYVNRDKVSAARAIEIIHECGGVAGIAHPGVLPSGRELGRTEIQSMVDNGLQAIEVRCPRHTEGLVEAYRGIASEMHLVETAGSDFHGLDEDRQIPLGACTCSIETVRELEEIASKIT